MAALATSSLAAKLQKWKLSKWIPRAAEDGQAPAPGGAGRIRVFPNEDIYFFVKQIDNSAVIRAADPAEERASWKMIVTAAAAAMLAIGVLLPKGYSVLAGYKIQSLLQERAELLRERDALELSEAVLMSPERMVILARQQQFIDPPNEQVVHLEDPSGARVTAAAGTDVTQ